MGEGLLWVDRSHSATLLVTLRIVLQKPNLAAALLVARQRTPSDIRNPWANITVMFLLRASKSDANWFCCYLQTLHFGSVPPDV